MRIKMGTVVPKKGTIVHLGTDAIDYRGASALALRLELGSTHRATKTVMRWIGASERTVKYWFAGERGPSGEHLILLARHSDMVFHMVLLQTGRYDGEDPEVR
ncbi:XRE family transcriptional regulator [Amaricoccus sp.]|uniref:XRE family transcriptional regulator n=1 Tax=Amaricoccus sp. TaxID=1872485 RepID=UPI00262CB3A5|nr:XRE family transcriptional regulator [Amaricoccus sp.]HRO12141.1 XRE family transcriptional regulator [Amaricoccus sp.]